MPQIIQFKRRIPGSGAPASGTGAGQVTAGEPAVAISAAGVADLYIGDGAVVRTLVSSARQVEVTGDQSVAGDKTFTGTIVVADPTHFEIGGGNDGDVLTTDGAGGHTWEAPPKGVTVAASAPGSPDTGDAWFNTTNNELRIWNGSTWILPNVTVSGTAPGTPSTGKLWYNSTTHVLSVWNGTAWAATTGNRSAGGGTAPTPANEGDIWWSPTGPQVYITGAWAAATLPGFAGVATEPPITGDGQVATPLGVTTATDAQIAAGTNDVYPIDSAGLHDAVLGDVPAALLVPAASAAAARRVVPAINELVGDISDLGDQIAALTGALRFVGNFDADANEVTSADAGTLTVGDPLPAAASGNEGWFVIVVEAGTVPAPPLATPTAVQVGDWIVSTGSAWIHVPLYHAAITAANVGVTAIDSAGWGNVQAALQGLFNLVGGALTSVEVDDVSIIGDGTSGDPLEVATVDGGTY